MCAVACHYIVVSRSARWKRSRNYDVTESDVTEHCHWISNYFVFFFSFQNGIDWLHLNSIEIISVNLFDVGGRCSLWGSSEFLCRIQILSLNTILGRSLVWIWPLKSGSQFVDPCERAKLFPLFRQQTVIKPFANDAAALFISFFRIKNWPNPWLCVSLLLLSSTEHSIHLAFKYLFYLLHKCHTRLLIFELETGPFLLFSKCE